MLKLTQTEAAHRVGIEERTFRQWVDGRIVLPTPETRLYGRGRPKTFSADEIAIGLVLVKLQRLGAAPVVLAQFADWLRRNSGGEGFRDAANGKPVFLRLWLSDDGSWAGDFETARGDLSPGNPGEQIGSKRIPVTRPDDPDQLADFLLVLNLSDVVRRANAPTDAD